MAKSDFLGDAEIFLGRGKKNIGIFGGCEKRTKGFGGGMLKKKVVIGSYWQTNSEVVIPLGIKYKPLSPPPPPPNLATVGILNLSSDKKKYVLCASSRSGFFEEYVLAKVTQHPLVPSFLVNSHSRWRTR